MKNALQYLNRRVALGAAFSLIIASAATGQTASSATSQGVSPIDQGVADLSPLSASLLHSAADLRAVRQFDLVYPVPGRPDMLMRQSGALSAVFEYSDYAAVEVDDEEVIATLIPAGTVFYIGSIADARATNPYSPVRPPQTIAPELSATLRVTQQVNQHGGAQLLSVPQAQRIGAVASIRPEPVSSKRERPSGNIVTISDERYRRYRLNIIARELASTAQ